MRPSLALLLFFLLRVTDAGAQPVSEPAEMPSLAGAQARAAQAARYEAQAFQLVANERWCEALGLFLAAQQAAPTAARLEQAAQAASFARDQRRAVLLYLQLAAAQPSREPMLRPLVKRALEAISAGDDQRCALDVTALSPPVPPAPNTTAPQPTPWAPVEAAPANQGAQRYLWLALGGGAATLASAAVFSSSFWILRNPRSSGQAKAIALPFAAPTLVTAGAAGFASAAGLTLWLLHEESEQ